MTPKRTSGSHASAPSETELLTELLGLLREAQTAKEPAPKKRDLLQSVSLLAGILAVAVGAVLFLGGFFNRLSAVENTQAKAAETYVTKDAFKGMSDKIDGMTVRQIEIERKLDAYIMQQEKKP